jgi:cyclomaltodextrinase
MLTPGEYQYLLVIDGKEQRDPANPDSVDNNIGGFNSLLKVGSYKQEDLPYIHSQKIQAHSFSVECNTPLEGIYVFWQNELISNARNTRELKIKIPHGARDLDRSFVRIIGYDLHGFSNDMLIPLDRGRVILDAAKLDRHDRQTMIMYFMMVDRFRDGDPSNDKKVDDPEIRPKANYFGGDIEGIYQELLDGYFSRLGVNTLWLSPISQNPEGAYGLWPDPRSKFAGYHGYWPVSLTKIDYRFGTKADLKKLISEAHHQGMNVLLDYVANHVHELHPVYRQHPDWATNLYLPDGSLNTEKWDEYRLTTWFDTFLPTLDLRRPEVVEPMTDTALYWFRNYDLDGFRHDATKHIDELYWRTLTRKLKLYSGCDPMPYQIGETYGSPELIASYISSGMLDAQFDFNVYDNALGVFARDEEHFDRLQAMLNESLRYYGYHNLMGNITGNQDKARFISLAGGDLSFSENAKYAGWTRDIGTGDPSSYEKLKLLHAFNMTIPGIPTIYYGDEVGIPGANDPDNRRWMKFDNLTPKELSVRETVSKLAHFRRNSMPLLYGDIRFIEHTDKTWVFMRSYFGQVVYVLFNKNDQPETLVFKTGLNGESELKALMGNEFIRKQDKIEIDLPARSFEILYTN